MSKPQIVRRLVDALSLTEGLPEVGWCVFVLSTEQEVCQLLVDQGVIGTAFNLLEKLVNEQVSNCMLTYFARSRGRYGKTSICERVRD